MLAHRCETEIYRGRSENIQLEAAVSVGSAEVIFPHSNLIGYGASKTTPKSPDLDFVRADVAATRGGAAENTTASNVYSSAGN